MKNKLCILATISFAAVLCGCVNVDSETAPAPTRYWKAPKSTIPDEIIEPEQIKTDKILNKEDAGSNKGNSERAKPASASEKMLAGIPLDLSELLDIALENNTQTRSYWFQSKAYAAAVGTAQSSYYPQVSVSMDAYRGKTHPSLAYFGNLAVGSYYETGYGPSAQINWLLYDFGKRESQVNSAREALRAANFDYNQVIQDVALSVNVAYYSYYEAVGGVKSAQMNIEDAKTAYDSAKARLDEGVGNKQDMLNALANLRNAEFSLETAKASVETAKANLANALGVRVSQTFKVSDEVKIPDSPQASQKIDNLIASAMRSRQTLLASYAQLRKTQSDIETARRDFLPQIGASASASYVSYTAKERGDQYAYQGGLTASWSLFEGFARKYELISAKAKERAQAQALKAAEIQIISDVWTYYHNYQSALKQVESSQAAIDASQEAFNATKVGYESGVNSITDFLNAQYRLAQARQQKVSAQAGLCKSIAQLAHATGALTATVAPEDMPIIGEDKKGR